MSVAAEPSTPHFADACLHLGVAPRLVQGLQPLRPEWRIEGPARCVLHFGSVDIFLEAIDEATLGDILIIDNEARDDEGCIGDLTTAEALHGGIAGAVVWGRHRDSAELRRLGLPLFSLGSCALGPMRLDARAQDAFGRAQLGAYQVEDGDWIVADDDGLLIFSNEAFPRVRALAAEICAMELRQSSMIANGQSLRHQLQFERYRLERNTNPTSTFREHVRRLGGAIEA